MGVISRRQLGAAGFGLAAGLTLPGPSFAEAPRSSAFKPLARVIVDNDLAGDPDGLLALAYQLVAPTTKTVLVTTTALDPRLTEMAKTLPVGRTAARGAELARELIALAPINGSPPVRTGSESFGAGPKQITEAAHAIVAEAKKTDELPLILSCGGPLTNVAAALRIDPAIARKMKVVWIGGRSYPIGGEEYNLTTDLDAARQVVELSKVPLKQIPVEAYSRLFLSQAELLENLKPISPLTSWLYDKLVDLPSFVPRTGSKGIGDCALVPLAAVSDDAGQYMDQPARRIGINSRYGEALPGRTVRLYADIDVRLTIADMLAVFHMNAKA